MGLHARRIGSTNPDDRRYWCEPCGIDAPRDHVHFRDNDFRTQALLGVT